MNKLEVLKEKIESGSIEQGIYEIFKTHYTMENQIEYDGLKFRKDFCNSRDGYSLSHGLFCLDVITDLTPDEGNELTDYHLEEFLDLISDNVNLECLHIPIASYFSLCDMYGNELFQFIPLIFEASYYLDIGYYDDYRSIWPWFDKECALIAAYGEHLVSNGIAATEGTKFYFVDGDGTHLYHTMNGFESDDSPLSVFWNDKIIPHDFDIHFQLAELQSESIVEIYLSLARMKKLAEAGAIPMNIDPEIQIKQFHMILDDLNNDYRRKVLGQ